MASIVSVPNETSSSSSRYTRDGRRITYHLDVIQQPQRARACGSGAKSSADRRPVDPPPIVVLRIFEGDAMNEITFSYNANFFLFATLENARTIAQGRLPPSQTSIPVLTGTPVAGMSYLDRPQPAGYFIFPDLSVRHEGKYRLSFTLYEQLKDGKDGDEDNHITVEVPQINAHVSHRLEVKSTPFTVYSAKRFPGLAESTTLSTTVAEQGCRVRIRKDVRMRRRDPKPSAKWQNYEDETVPDCTRRTPTPDSYGQQHMHSIVACDSGRRSRSVSLISNGNVTPVNLQQRRSSPHETPQSYIHEYGPAPQTPQQHNYSHNALYDNGLQHIYYSQNTGQQPPPIYQQPTPQQQTPPLTSPHHPHYSQQHPHHSHHHHQYQQQQQQEYQQMMQPPQAPYQPSAPSCHTQHPVSYQQPHAIPQNLQNPQVFRSQPKVLEYCAQIPAHDEHVHQPQNASQFLVSHPEHVNTGHVSNAPDNCVRQQLTSNTNPAISQGPLMQLRDGIMSAGYHSAQTDILQPHPIKSELVYTNVCFPQPTYWSERRTEMTKMPESISTPQSRSHSVKRERPKCKCGTARLVDGRRPDIFAENENCSCQSSDEEVGHSDSLSMMYRRADGSFINRRVLGSG